VFGHALLQAVLRQDAGEQAALGVGQVSGAGWQYSITGSPISFRSASVRTPANCAGRSRRGTRPKVS
jgi:hypothetical protein